ncbi:unnamed protein product, partial [Ectocarpus sp. 4 AP-2014]
MYPKSKKKARDWAAEEAFATAWRPSSRDGYATLSSKDASEVEPAAPRTKRPRDCQQAPAAADHI